MRNLLGAVRRRDQAAVKADAQAIYRAASRAEADSQAHAFPTMARRVPSTGPPAPSGAARVARVLPVSPLAVAASAHHERDRALLRRGPPSHAPDGVFGECAQRGTDYLFHL